MGGLNSALIEKSREATKVRAEIAVKLYDILQKDNDWHTSKELSEALGLGRERVKTIMVQEVKPKHPDVVSSKHLGYKISKKIEARMPSKRKNTDMKNSEGYSDPTAGMAIRNAEADNPHKSAGEVWRTEAANGDVEYFLVFAEYFTTRLGIPLYIQPASRFVDPIIIDSLGGAKLYGDCTQVKSKPKKYMIDTIGMIETEQLNDIRRRTCEAISIPANNVWSQPEKVVEPIVVNGKVYTERDILELLAHEDSSNQIIDSLTKEYETLKQQNNKMEEAIRMRDLANTQLIDENRELKKRLEEKTSVEQMEVGGKVFTRDEVISALAATTVYQRFFDSYCRGLEAGE